MSEYFFAVQFMSFALNYMCITCTAHQTVIVVEHFAIASARFLVLLTSFAVQRKGIILYG